MEQIFHRIISGEQSVAYDQIDALIHNKQFEELEQFIQLLIQHWIPETATAINLRYSRRYSRVINGLAMTAGPEYVKALLALLRYQTPGRDLDFIRQLAATLAIHQTPEILDNPFETPYSPIWPYLIHELVIEGIPISLLENLSGIAQTMQKHTHPFSVLPLTLLSSESQIYIQRGSRNTVFPESHDRLTKLEPEAGILWEETTTPELKTRLQSAFKIWAQGNGHIEARQFTAQQPISKEMVTGTRLLFDLRLDCLQGSKEITIWKSRPENILSTLFFATAHGGAYGLGLGNVEGRLAAWKSAEALVNAAMGTSITTLNDIVETTYWCQFTASSSWFYGDICNEAIVALSLDGHILTVLAATDTD